MAPNIKLAGPGPYHLAVAATHHEGTATSVHSWSAQAVLKLPSVSTDAVELAREAGLSHWLGLGRGARTYLILGPDSREARAGQHVGLALVQQLQLNVSITHIYSPYSRHPFSASIWLCT
jgi:hypothetical protein